MTREPSQTTEIPSTCTGRPVPTMKSWDAGSGVETKRDCGIIHHTISSDSEENLEVILIDEFEENQDSWKSFLGTEIPVKDRVWHGIEPAKLDRNFDRSWVHEKTSKKLAKLVRYELSHFQEEDGAIPFERVLPEFTPDMEVRIPPYIVPWPTRIWISELSIGGKRKRFQYCVNPDHHEYIQYIRVFERHSEAKRKRTIHNNCSGQNREDSYWQPFTNWDDWYYHSSYCKTAVSLKNHLYRHAEDYQRPIPPQDQDRQRRGCEFSDTYSQSVIIDPTTGWRFWPRSSSSSSWWRSDAWD